MVAKPDTDLRTGAALQKAARAFAVEHRGRSWWAVISTIIVLGSLMTVAAVGPFPLNILASIVAGLTAVRMFVLMHDHLHGAILRDSKPGKAVFWLYSIFCMSPASVWRETHDYHHRNNAKMLGGSIGSYPVVTAGMWRGMNPSQRRWYAFARHPLTMLFGYVTIFVGGMCLSSFMRRPKVHWGGPVAILVHFGSAALVSYLVGAWYAGVLAVVVPNAISCALGAYLFYAQHNFPDIELRGRRTWDYQFAALRSSSMFDMSAPMHWFTGNIGYHHVHHLNHRIPFYRLPEAMAAIPELQDPGRTTWWPGDVIACLRLKVWDDDAGKMVGWADL